LRKLFVLYVLHDYAVFGYGETRQDAIVMAAQWLKDETGKERCSVDSAESLLLTSPEHGQLTLNKMAEIIPLKLKTRVGESCWIGIMIWLEAGCGMAGTG
jgi:hypothetical protein